MPNLPRQYGLRSTGGWNIWGRVAKSFKQSLNFMLILEILEKSLNFYENFGGSLKSPWILKMILEILEFCVQCDILYTNCSIGAARQQFDMSCTQFERAWNLQKGPWNILGLSLNFIDEISWQPCECCLFDKGSTLIYGPLVKKTPLRLFYTTFM